MKIKIIKKDGVIVEGKEKLGELFNSIKDGEIVVSLNVLSLNPQSIEEWRKYYFHLRDDLHEATDTGYTKKELHEVIKNKTLKEMMEFASNNPTEEWWFDVDWANPMSTKSLTEYGWKEFVKRFKEFAMDTFNIYL